MKRLGSVVSNGFSKVWRPLGLVAALAMALVAAPGAALAAGWHGGGGAVASRRIAQVPGGAFHKGFSPNYYNRVVTPTRPGGRVYVPGYWGWRGGARVWVGPTWASPPSPGWVWVPARWVWNGYSWVWQNGYWAPPF